MSWLPLASTQSQLISSVLGPHSLSSPNAGTDVTTKNQLDLRLSQSAPTVSSTNLQLLNTGKIGDSTTLTYKNGPSDFVVEGATEIAGVNTRFTYAGINQIPVSKSDLINLSDVSSVTLPANTAWFLRCSQRTASLGVAMPRPYTMGPGTLVRNSYNTNAVNQVDGTGAINVTGEGASGWGPLAVIGVPSAPLVSVAIVGTSIDFGFDDLTADSQSNIGYWAKGLDALPHYVPMINLSHASQTLAANLSSPNGDLDRSFYKYVNVICMGPWSPDFGTLHRTLTQVQTDTLTVIGNARSARCKVYASYMLPRIGTSTDGFTTQAGQTTFFSAEYAPGAARDQYNTWLGTLTDAGTIDGVVDTCNARYKLTGGTWVSTGASFLEDQTHPCYWDTTGGVAITPDGTHPNTTGVARMSPVVTALATALSW